MRFYKAELFPGRKLKAINFEETDEKTSKVWRYGDHLSAVLARFKETQVRGFPRSPDAAAETAEDIRKKTTVIFNDVTPLGSAGITAEFRVGRSDDYDRAYPAPDTGQTEYVDLVGYSPTRPYRAALLLPNSGTIGILAVEAIGRACPYEFFTRWVSNWSREHQTILDTENPLGEDKVRPWWRLKATPLGSRDQLNVFLEGGDPQELVLLKHYYDSERNERHERFRLTAKVGVTERFWARKKLDDVLEIESDAAFAQQLADSYGNTVEQLDIDDGYLVVKTPAGIVKKISPSRLPEVFTYPVSDSRPTLSEFKAAVKTQGIALAKVIDAKVDFASW
ncbi:hypothetical protein ACRCUN_17065 [Mycobacterium sp. LTG2003]